MGDFGQVGGLVTLSAWTYEYITVIHKLYKNSDEDGGQVTIKISTCK